jgi:hypothetical protein
MKFIVGIFSIVFGVLMIVGALILVFAMMLMILPGTETIGVVDINGLQQTLKDGAAVVFSEKVVDVFFPWGLVGTTVGAALFFIALTWRKSSFYTNLYVLTLTTLASIIVLGLAIAVFVLSGEYQTVGLPLTMINKIGIGVCLAGYLFVRLLGGKVNKVIERKIQAYENDMELRQVGRSNPIVINLLKTISFMCPEVIVVTLLALLNKTLAPYFWSILITAGIMTVGAIWRDINKRREAKRKMLADKINQAKAIASIIEGKSEGSAKAND